MKKNTEDRLASVPGYNITRLDRQTVHANGQTKSGGGLCIYYKESLQIDTDSLAKLNTSNETIEVQWITVTRPHTKKILIGNVYRPPSSNLREAFQTISDKLSAVPNIHKYEILLMGDFNADAASSNKLPPARIIKQFEAEHSLKQVIDKPTRYSKAKRATIDLAFTNIKHCTGSGTVNYNISDHKPIYILKKKVRNDETTKATMGRTYRNYTHEQLADTIREHIPNEALYQQNPNECWETILLVINKAIDKHCPLIQMRIRNTSAPYITSEILNLQSDRDYFANKADISLVPGDRFIANCMAKVVRREIRKAKAKYFLNQAIIFNQEPKKFWFNYNKIQPKLKPTINNILDHRTGEKVPDDKMPENINNFFIDIGEDLASKCKKIDPNNRKYNPPLNKANFTLQTVDSGVLLYMIQNLETHKPSGIDNMSSAFLKEVMAILINEFTHLYNLTISTGLFPDKWKTATVTPIPKVPNPKSCNDLRPISILPLPGRLMEKIIHDQMKKFLEDSKFFAPEQNGFRSQHSTAKALASILDQLSSNFDNNELSISVFIDFKKAFDTIDHKILIDKLRAAGFDHPTCALIANYLMDRSQSTKLNGHSSKSRTVKTGVPQGSTLGPLLFLIFINDLPLISKIANFILFADDAVLTISNKSLSVAATIMNTILKEINLWCIENKLTLNTKKTEYVIFGTKTNKNKAGIITLKLGEAILEEVESYKYLGTVLDATLNINAQIARLNQILAPKIHSFSKMRYCMSEKTANYIYKATILPIIDYNDIIYTYMTKQQEAKLQRIQNRALRIVYRGRSLSVDEMHTKAGIAKLALRREIHLLTLMYKRSFQEEFLDQTPRITRQGRSKTLKVPNPKTNKLKNAPIYNGSTLWNNLPARIREATSILAFKNLLRGHLTNPVPPNAE